MRRRRFVAMVGAAAAWPLLVRAQQAASGLPLVAVLWPGKPEVEADYEVALRRGLQESGFIEGTNFAFAMRYADADFARLAPLAAELAALKPLVIIAVPDDAVLAAHRAAPTVPIVGAIPSDPVAAGLAASFARPGGMVTGLTLNALGGEAALTGKRVGLLKELVPGLARLGMILLADAPESVEVQNGAKGAAGRLGLDVLPFPVRTLDDVAAAFVAGVRAGAGAFYVDGRPLMFSNRAKVAEFAIQAGKPAIGQLPDQARAGLLLSYGVDLADSWHSYGLYAAKILAGAKPGDLPIVQASRFKFVINLKTATALGLTIPPMLLARADEVIE